MLLVVDMGNTHTVLGGFEENELVFELRMATNRKATSDEWGLTVLQLLERQKVDVSRITGIAYASVVPQLEWAMQNAFERYLGQKALCVDETCFPDMAIEVDSPSEVGADRLVNAYAAWHQFKSAMVLVDFGTATTFDVVSSSGAYLGGAIAPGMELASDALFHKAAKLPRVDVVRTHTVMGKNTSHAIRSGLFWGYVGLVDGLVNRLKLEMNEPCMVIATGGLAKLFAGSSETLERVEPHLTLQGLRLLYDTSRARL
jgi:type III pantothenate kinase